MMFKVLKKLILFVGAIGCITLLSADFSAAQTFKEKHRNQNLEIDTSVDFLKEFGAPSEIMSAVESSEEGKITCGNTSTLCDRETQICLRCQYSYIVGVSSTRYDHGKCVSKSGFDENNLRKSFGTENCPSTSSTFCIGMGVCTTTTAGTITIERSGFLSQGETNALFWTISKDSHGFKGSDGKEYSLAINGNQKLTIAYGGTGDGNQSFKGCEVFPVKVAEMGGCFYCDLAKIVYSTAQKVAGEAFGKFSWPFRVIIGVIFAIWLVLISSNYAFSMTKQDAPKFLSSLLQMSFKIALVYFLLAFPEDIFKYFIRPFLEGGINLGTAIQSIEASAPADFSQGTLTISGSYYGSELWVRIEKYLALIQAQMAYIQALGSTLWCVGSHHFSFWKLITFQGAALDAIRIMFLGAFLFIFALLITISFGFYFVDALIHLILLAAMLPLMIATWPLPFKTTKFASSGFQMFLNVFFTFFFVGFVVSVCWILIDNSMAIAQEMTGNDVTEENLQENGFVKIIDALHDQNFQALNKATDIGLKGFLLLLFGCLFGFQFIAQAVQLASQLSGDKGSLGLASRVATMGASLAKGAAMRLAKPVAGAVVDEYHEQGGVTGMLGGLTKELGGLAEEGGKMLDKAGDGINKAAGAAKAIPYVGGALMVVGKAAGYTVKATGKTTKITGKVANKIGAVTQKLNKKLHSAYRKAPR